MIKANEDGLQVTVNNGNVDPRTAAALMADTPVQTNIEDSRDESRKPSVRHDAQKPKAESFVDSAWVDAALVLGIGALAIVAAPIAGGVLSVGLLASAASLAVDVITHRLKGDTDGVLKRPGSLIKAAVAGVAVALCPLTSLKGVVAAVGGIALTEALINDRPDESGSLFVTDVVKRIEKTLGVDLSKFTPVMYVTLVAGLFLLMSRLDNGTERRKSDGVKSKVVSALVSGSARVHRFIRRSNVNRVSIQS